MPSPPEQQQLKHNNNSSSDPHVGVNEDGTVFKINLSKRLPGRTQLTQTTSSSTITSTTRKAQRKLSGAKIVLSE